MADEFKTIDDIEKHFGKLRKEAGDDEARKKELTLQEREAKADFRDRLATIRDLEAHRREVIAKNGIPEDFADYVQGDTPEEIDAAAGKIKDRVDKLMKAAGDKGAQDLYGKTSLGNGGGSPPPPRTPDEEKWIADFQGRFMDPSQSVTIGEINRYTELLGGAHLLHELAETSRYFKRAGITPELVAEHERGELRQQRPPRSGVQVAPRA